MSLPAKDLAESETTKIAMDNMYRWTRHIYDASRKYYLLGRDHLIQKLNPEKTDLVCEVGCGTARNLLKMAKYWPDAAYFGIDASDEMLKTAEKSIRQEKLNHPLTLPSPQRGEGYEGLANDSEPSRSWVGGKIKVAQGYAQSFNPEKIFDVTQFDKIVFSYALSIIPPWRESIDHALNLLKPGGEIHIVDFGSQNGMPRLFRKLLFWWLSMFHVYYKPEIENYLQRLAHEKKGALRIEPLYNGYSYYAVFKKT